MPADAGRTIDAAGGTLVASYGQIGVAVARSDDASFAMRIEQDSRVAGASATSGLGVRLNDGAADSAVDVIDASGATYCYRQGTSMASPHAAGVAAPIASTGISSPGSIIARLQNTADNIDCPPDGHL